MLPGCESILQSPVFCLPCIRSVNAVSPTVPLILSLYMCVCVSDLALLLFSDFLMAMPKTRRPTKQKRRKEKKLYRSLPVWFFRLLCSVFGPYALLERSTQHHQQQRQQHRPPLRLRQRPQPQHRHLSQRAKGVQFRFELKSYHFCCCCCCALFFRFVLAAFFCRPSSLGRPS